MKTPVTWAVLGTANIAARAFLPSMRDAGGGRAVVVGSRDTRRAQEWAAEFGVESGVGSYADALADPRVQAVYVALPNTEHLHWAAAALRAGKVVLCEKPLTPSVADTETLLSVARETGGLLWEGFVFPFHPQTHRLAETVAAARIGDLREIESSFHFRVRDPANIRLDPALAGGAIFDVGCYPIRLARLLFGAEPVSAVGAATLGASGVETDAAAVVDFPGDRRLVFTVGLRRSPDTCTRLLGEHGTIRIDNPFHPRPHDAVTVTSEPTGPDDVDPDPAPAGPGSAFTHAVRHIQAVVRGLDEPRHLAVHDAAPQARAVELVRTALALSRPPASRPE